MRLSRRQRLSLTLVVAALALLWAGLPPVKAFLLLRTSGSASAPAPPPGLAVQEAVFHASDGVLLRGWFVAATSSAPSIVLVAGFKETRVSMVLYARFLHAAGYNILLYDGRGLGQSGGRFSAGLRETDDVRGAVAYLTRRPDLRDHHYGLLGVSLGAGVTIVAAADLPAVAATIADSAYTDQRFLVARLNTLVLGPLSLPLAPLGPPTVDRLLGAPLASFSPLQAVGRIAPRALLLIHSRDDANPTTPLTGALALSRASGGPSRLWIAPRGGHAGAFAAQPAVYERHVLAFLRRWLGAPVSR